MPLQLLRKTIDILLPPRCLATGEIVDKQGMLAPDFWSQLSFIEKPFCVTCGVPFGFSVTGDTLCAPCMESEPVFDRARAAVVYNDPSRQLLLAFKYGDRLQAADTFLPWLLRAGSEMIAESDIIVPVPLHARRLWQRRFNQSALLAQAVAASAKKQFLPEALIRLRHTVPQKGMNRKERKDNVRGAFCANGRYAAALTGKNILLIDDVLTSGATLNECARTLKRAGASSVFILTVARVTKEEF
jgi:ComF family protein